MSRTTRFCDETEQLAGALCAAAGPCQGNPTMSTKTDSARRMGPYCAMSQPPDLLGQALRTSAPTCHPPKKGAAPFSEKGQALFFSAARQRQGDDEAAAGFGPAGGDAGGE